MKGTPRTTSIEDTIMTNARQAAKPFDRSRKERGMSIAALIEDIGLGLGTDQDTLATDESATVDDILQRAEWMRAGGKEPQARKSAKGIIVEEPEGDESTAEELAEMFGARVIA